jgi:hypothetical protein
MWACRASGLPVLTPDDVRRAMIFMAALETWKGSEEIAISREDMPDDEIPVVLCPRCERAGLFLMDDRGRSRCERCGTGLAAAIRDDPARVMMLGELLRWGESGFREPRPPTGG